MKSTKGMVFALDATIAAIITLAIVFAGIAYSSSSAEDLYESRLMLKQGYDIVTALDNEGAFADSVLLESRLDEMHLYRSIRIAAEYEDGLNLTAGDEMPDEGEIVSGRYYLYERNYFAIVRFWIWR